MGIVSSNSHEEIRGLRSFLERYLRQLDFVRSVKSNDQELILALEVPVSREPSQIFLKPVFARITWDELAQSRSILSNGSYQRWEHREFTRSAAIAVQIGELLAWAAEGVRPNSTLVFIRGEFYEAGSEGYLVASSPNELAVPEQGSSKTESGPVYSVPTNPEIQRQLVLAPFINGYARKLPLRTLDGELIAAGTLGLRPEIETFLSEWNAYHFAHFFPDSAWATDFQRDVWLYHGGIYAERLQLRVDTGTAILFDYTDYQGVRRGG
jgi:hypothetical protein